jgi:hypothetical protein
MGYHSIAQVAVGWVLGSGVASSWWLVGHRKLLPYLAASDPMYSKLLYGLTVVAVVVFSYTNVRRWVQEKMS